MDPGHKSLMPHAIPTIFHSIPNPPQMIEFKRQQKEQHAPETRAGMHLILFLQTYLNRISNHN